MARYKLQLTNAKIPKNIFQMQSNYPKTNVMILYNFMKKALTL